MDAIQPGRPCWSYFRYFRYFFPTSCRHLAASSWTTTDLAGDTIGGTSWSNTIEWPKRWSACHKKKEKKEKHRKTLKPSRCLQIVNSAWQELGCILTWVICTFYCSGFRWKCPVSTANFHTLVGDQLQIGPTGRANTKTSPLTRNQPSNLNITQSGVQNHNPAWSTGVPEFIIIPPWTSGLTLDITIGNHPPAIRVLLLRSQLFRLLHLKAGGWNSYGIWLLRSNGLRDHFRDLSDCSFNDKKCPIVWSSKNRRKWQTTWFWDVLGTNPFCRSLGADWQVPHDLPRRLCTFSCAPEQPRATKLTRVGREHRSFWELRFSMDSFLDSSWKKAQPVSWHMIMYEPPVHIGFPRTLDNLVLPSLQTAGSGSEATNPCASLQKLCRSPIHKICKSWDQEICQPWKSLWEQG